jgi:hypothetical protein
MELLVLILALCALDLLALRFGHDSRHLGLPSAEERLARRGMAWQDRELHD